jgi:hypothetical protein
MGQIGMPVTAPQRRPDRDENGIRAMVAQVSSEG